MASSSITGAHVIARTLRDLRVTVVFGLVGVPASDIAEQAINLGIRFIGFRNEQAASYAATAYGYLTGKPGVCLVVGGPGVLHAISGVGNSSANCFPLLLLGGSSESYLVTKGGFQELDTIALLTLHTKPGTAFVDLPADLMTDPAESPEIFEAVKAITSPPAGAADSRMPVEGKGAAYAKAEIAIREFIDKTRIPFLPSPMGKGIVPDSHPQNASSARSTALQHADTVLILGARLNWIFHYGEAPKWNPTARFVQVDIAPEEIGHNNGDADLGIVGDVNIVVPQLLEHLSDWHFDDSLSDFTTILAKARKTNELKAAAAAADPSVPLSYAHTFDVIKSALHPLSPPENGGIIYVSEGSNTMDISRSVFSVEHPRLRLDAGSYATMGVGLGYAIAAHEAYNGIAAEATSGSKGRKKVIAIEGDSAFGFSGMEFETMARFQMDILIFVINNGGIYFGDSNSAEDWLQRQAKTVSGTNGPGGLRSWALGWEVGYEKFAEACGGKGFLVRTPEELYKATVEGYNAKVPCIVNVAIQGVKVEKPNFGWQSSRKKKAIHEASTKAAKL